MADKGKIDPKDVKSGDTVKIGDKTRTATSDAQTSSGFSTFDTKDGPVTAQSDAPLDKA